MAAVALWGATLAPHSISLTVIFHLDLPVDIGGEFQILRDGIVDPVTGKAAQVHSERLGFPKRNRQQSGTSIMILDFDSNGEDLDSVGKQVVEGLLWNFWPRLMRDTPSHQRFKCMVEINGSRLSVPQPEEFPPLDLFSKAMRSLRSDEGIDLQQIFCRRPLKLLGNLAIERGLRTTRKPIVAKDSLFSGSLTSHCTYAPNRAGREIHERCTIPRRTT